MLRIADRLPQLHRTFPSAGLDDLMRLGYWDFHTLSTLKIFNPAQNGEPRFESCKIKMSKAQEHRVGCSKAVLNAVKPGLHAGAGLALQATHHGHQHLVHLHQAG